MIRSQRQVSGVGVRMEEPVDQDLLQVALEALAGELLPIQLHPTQGAERGDRQPPHPLHHEDT